MLEKLAALEEQYREIEQRLTAPEVFSDPAAMSRLLRDQKELTPIVECYRRYRMAAQTVQESLELLRGPLDADFRDLVQEELEQAKQQREELEQELKILLLPKDPNDSRSVIMEIRGGVGGEEAALFAADLYRMYSMYAERRRWKVEVLNRNETEIGGIKEICLSIDAQGAFSRLKFESGIHRVQRVPQTEAGGRIHTSAASVAVLPQADDVEVDINPNDLQIDTFRSSGAGGQHINKTESAIRITHLPTGMVVECQDERSQYKNKDRAMRILKSRLLEARQREQDDDIAAQRRSQVGSGDRSERIRTYNFPQGRVTDHRIGLTLYRIDAIMDGDLDEIVDALITADQAQRLQSELGTGGTI